MKKTLVYLSLFFISFNLYPSHTFNGEMNVRRIQHNNTTQTFAVDFIILSDCKPNTIQLPSSFDVCVYQKKNGQLVKTIKINQVSSTRDTNCFGVCLRKNIYSTSTELPIISDAYLFKTDFCCRTTIDNLTLDINQVPFQGNSIKTLISGDTLHKVPSILMQPLINLNLTLTDTIPYLLEDNYADSISIVSEAPLTGATLADNYPGCSTSYNFLDQSCEYASGYSSVQPFGIGETFQLDADNNRMILGCKKQGFYILSFKIQTFKNNELIYETHREVMVIASNSNQTKSTLTLRGSAMPNPVSAIQWTGCIRNITHYIVERSDTFPYSFNPIDTVTSNMNYYNDWNVSNGKVYYYRLNTIPFDSNYSNILKITFFNKSIFESYSTDENGLKISPNPSSESINLQLAEGSIGQVKIMSYNGQLIYSETNTDSKINMNYDVSFFSPGLYVVEAVAIDGTVHSRLFQKQ